MYVMKNSEGSSDHVSIFILDLIYYMHFENCWFVNVDEVVMELVLCR